MRFLLSHILLFIHREMLSLIYFYLVCTTLSIIIKKVIKNSNYYTLYNLFKELKNKIVNLKRKHYFLKNICML